MRVQEGSVTKQFWMKLFRLISRKIKSDDRRRIPEGQIKIIRVKLGPRTCAYAAVMYHEDHFRPVAWLYLWQRPGWKAWEVMQVFVFEKFRGAGLSKKLYKAATDENLMIISGESQSRHSRALWASFIKKRSFEIFAIDRWDLKARSQVFWDAEFNEPWCQFDIYCTGTVQDRDVRLIAIRKKS